MKNFVIKLGIVFSENFIIKPKLILWNMDGFILLILTLLAYVFGASIMHLSTHYDYMTGKIFSSLVLAAAITSTVILIKRIKDDNIYN